MIDKTNAMPIIMLVDVPAGRNVPVQFRAYRDRDCIHEASVRIDTIEELLNRTYTMWGTLKPAHLIIDASHDVERFLRDAMRYRGARSVGISR